MEVVLHVIVGVSTCVSTFTDLDVTRGDGEVGGLGSGTRRGRVPISGVGTWSRGGVLPFVGDLVRRGVGFW